MHSNPLSPNFSPAIVEPPGSTDARTVASAASASSATTATTITALARHDSQVYKNYDGGCIPDTASRLDYARKEAEAEEEGEGLGFDPSAAHEGVAYVPVDWALNPPAGPGEGRLGMLKESAQLSPLNRCVHVYSVVFPAGV